MNSTLLCHEPGTYLSATGSGYPICGTCASGGGGLMPRIAFDLFSVVAPRGWQDITASIEAIDPPPTLALDVGVGALQFSVALYEAGPVPDPSPSVLLKMVDSFADARDLGRPHAVAVESSPLRLASGSFDWGENFLRVWQVSDGSNFAFVTYTCESGQEGRELVECERIVRTLRFRGTRPQSNYIG